VHNILEFIWLFCVDYRPLNSVTEPYYVVLVPDPKPNKGCHARIDTYVTKNVKSDWTVVLSDVISQDRLENSILIPFPITSILEFWTRANWIEMPLKRHGFLSKAV